MKGRADPAHSQFNTLGIGTGISTPGIFPPLSPQCHPLAGAENRPGGAFSPSARAGAAGGGSGLDNRQGPGESWTLG